MNCGDTSSNATIGNQMTIKQNVSRKLAVVFRINIVVETIINKSANRNFTIVARTRNEMKITNKCPDNVMNNRQCIHTQPLQWLIALERSRQSQWIFNNCTYTHTHTLTHTHSHTFAMLRPKLKKQKRNRQIQCQCTVHRCKIIALLLQTKFSTIKF